jgi:hypothetical protein
LEDVIYDVSRISTNDSGYEIAKDLERGRAYYDIDTQFIEYLDDFGYGKRKILEKNVSDWVNAHNPKPKFEIGSKLIVNKSMYFRNVIGEIVFVNGYSKGQACYLVDKDPKRNGGTVISYEKVEDSCVLAV